MSDLTKVAPVQPGPAPSLTLLSQFAQEAERKRMEAGDCKVTASAAAEAAKKTQADAEQLAEQLRAILAEAERIRGVLDEKAAEADRHRARAKEHEERAAELLNDAAWMDEVNSRAGRLPAFQLQCCCNPLPGAPDAEQRRAACPVHSPAAAANGRPK